MSRITPQRINYLNPDEVFVFGSNMRGANGGGAAYQALQNGWTEDGHFYGYFRRKDGTGGFAIPTLGFKVETIPLSMIKYFVKDFIRYAEANTNLTFYVTALGCGIAGRSVADIAPMFRRAEHLKNVYLPKEFLDHNQMLRDARKKGQNPGTSKVRRNISHQTGLYNGSKRK